MVITYCQLKVIKKNYNRRLMVYFPFIDSKIKKQRLILHQRKGSHCMLANASEMGDLVFEWAGLKTLGYVISFRTEKGKETTAAIKFYISSAALEDAKALLNASRAH